MGTINGVLNIMVRTQVRAAQAQLQQLSQTINGVSTASSGAAARNNSLAASFDNVGRRAMSAGTQIQWVGRQLEYNWTLPIMAAGVAATKWGMDAVKAMTRVNKVYGDFEMSDGIKSSELEALNKNFTALSNKFGVIREEVIRIGADWAAAGSSGIALAKATDLTLRAMILGEMEAEKATKALISIQAQYGLSINELSYALSELNVIENETATSMQDLVTGFEKSASVARQAGVSTRELGAMLAALIPAAGSAETAGNGLRTMISRLNAPTKDTVDILRLMGIRTDDAAWASANATKKIEIMAEKYKDLDEATKNVASSHIASRWQVNRFGVLMEAVSNKASYYYKALDAAADRTKVLKAAEEELNTVLESSPNRFQQMIVIMQNSLASVMQPFLIYITHMAATLARLAKRFAEMDPEVRKLIMVLAIMLALLGPVVRYMGSIQTVFGAAIMVFGRLSSVLLAPLAAFRALLALPIGLFAAKTNILTSTLTGLIAKPIDKVVDRWSAAFNAWGVRSTAAVSAAVPNVINRMIQPFNFIGTGLSQALSAGTNAAMASWTASGGASAAAASSRIAKIIPGQFGIAAARIGSAMMAGAATTMPQFSAYMVSNSKFMSNLVNNTAFNGGSTFFGIWKSVIQQVNAEFVANHPKLAAIVKNTGNTVTAVASKSAAGFSKSWGIATRVAESIHAAHAPRVMAVYGAVYNTLDRMTLSTATKMSASWGLFTAQWDAQTKFYGSSVLGFTATILSKIDDVVQAGAGRVGAVWKTLGKSMNIVTRGTWSGILAQAQAFGATYSAGVAATGSRTLAIWTAWENLKLAVSTGADRKMIALKAVWGNLINRLTVATGAREVGLWAGIWTGITGVFAAGAAKAKLVKTNFLIWLMVTTKSAGGILPFLWRIIWGGISTVFSVFGKVTLGIYALFNRGLVAIMKSGVLLRIWGVMMRGMQFLAVGAWKGILLVFSKGMKALMVLLSGAGKAIIALFTTPWGLAILAVLGLIVLFKDQLGALFKRIGAAFSGLWVQAGSGVGGVAGLFGRFIDFIKKAFWSLPTEVQNAMMAVVRVVSNTAKAVYGFLQRINPFARFSPSLVDNVTNGVAVINQQFGNLKQIAGPIGVAYGHINNLKDITASLAEATFAAKYADAMNDIAENTPQALGSFQALIDMLPGMTRELSRLDKQVKAQELVVKGWKVQLDAATAAVERQEKAISKLREEADSYSSAIDRATTKISDLAGSPLVGMREMEDQINANTVAQNKLKLEMLKIKQAGGAYGDIENRLSAINGELETARAKRKELQMGGAGSEILQFYDDQIAALEAQKKATARSTEPLDEMQQALSELEARAELLDLEKAVKFDELAYEISKLADSSKELTFEEITSGIKAAQAEVAIYQPLLDGVNQKISEQESVLKGLQTQKDIIQEQYDAEDAKLQQVKESYDELADAINQVESALSDMGAAAGAVKQLREAGIDGALDAGKAAKMKKSKDGAGASLSPAEQSYMDSIGGTFDIPGGTGIMGREGGLGDQSAMIDEMTKGLTEETDALLSSMDMFAPIRKKWDEFKKWMQENINPAFAPIAEGARNLFDGIDFAGPFKEGGPLAKVGAFFESTWSSLKPNLEMAWRMIQRLFGDDFKKLIDEGWKGLKELWENLQPGFEALGKALPGIGIVLGIIVGVILVAIKLLVNLLTNIIRPVFAFIGDAISGLLKILGGVFKFLEGLFTLNPGKMLEGFRMIFDGLWGIIASLGSNLIALLLGVIGSVVDTITGVINAIFGTEIPGLGEMINGIVEWFKKLPGMIWKVLTDFIEGVGQFFYDLYIYLVGNSVVPDTINAIIEWFAGLPQRAIDAIVGFLNMIANWWAGIDNEFVQWAGFVFLGWINFWAGILEWVINTLANIVGWIGMQLAESWNRFQGFIAWVSNAWNVFWSFIYDWVATQVAKVLNALINWWNDVQTRWNNFTAFVSALWNTFWTTIYIWVMTNIARIVGAVVAWFTDMDNRWNNFMTMIRNAWNAFWDGVFAKGREIMTLISGVIETGLNSVQSFFQRAQEGIGRIWDGIRKVVADPIKFVVDTVINDTLIAGWNKLVSDLKLPGTLRIPELARNPALDRLAKGGRTRDRVPGSRAYGVDSTLAVTSGGRAIAMVDPGEGIIRRSAMQKLDRRTPGAFEYINKHGALPSFFHGGVMPTPGPVRPHQLPYWGARYAADMGYGTGSPIYAWRDGVVAMTRQRNVSYGWETVLNHGGFGSSQYAHQSAILVSPGQQVRAGQLIGRIGYSGNVRPPGPGGAHLHFEIRGGNSPISASASVDGGGGGMMYDLAASAIDTVLGKPVKDLIARIPGDGLMVDVAKGAGTMLIDEVVKKITSLIPFDFGDSSTSGAAAGGNWYDNAAQLMRAGKALGASRQAMKIALMTAAQESSMGTNRQAMYQINRDGDVGWFQQRATRGDGTVQQLADALYGLRVFLYGVRARAGYHVPGLYNISGWQNMALGSAAQRVQVSAYPRAYDKWAGPAEGWLNQFGYAKGTNSGKTGWHMVGENGPELMKFSGGERVLSNPATRKAVSDNIDQVISDMRSVFTIAFISAFANGGIAKQATLAARAIPATRDAGRRLDATDRPRPAATVENNKTGSGGVSIENAEFIFPNVKNGNDAEGFMRNLEEYLRRKGN